MITSVYENSTIKKSLDKWHTKNNSAIIALSQGESPHLWLKRIQSLSQNLLPQIDTANSRRHQAMFTDTDRLCDSGFTPETLSGSDFICVHLSTSEYICGKKWFKK